MMLRTPAQRKNLCRNCPVARVADLMGDSPSILILRDLLEKPRRFRDLQESLSGVSSRTLVSKLRRLASEHLIRRTESSGTHVEYALTPRGRALHDIMDAMRAYGEKYL